MTGQLGAFLGLLESFVGKDPNSSNSTMPAVTFQLLNLTGTMDINQLLAGFSLKIPGAPKLSTDTKKYYYDCPIGVFNLKLSPTIDVTTPYERIACPGQSVVTQNPYPVIEGYGANGMENDCKFIKFQIKQDFTAAFQEVPGLHFTSIKYALICKPQVNPQIGRLYYDIKNPIIKKNRFIYNAAGQTFDRSLENPVYYALNEERLIVHKYDPDNNDVWFGSPYMDENCLKGIAIEVPKHTDVRLAVIATFTIDGEESPFIFHGKYLFDIANTVTAANALRCGLESNQAQSTFPYSEYYNLPFSIALNNDPNTSQYSAYSISMTPNFLGTPGFSATAINNYKCNGMPIHDSYNYNCASNLRLAGDTPSDEEGNLITNETMITVYPNPSNGSVRISSGLDIEQDAEINIYNYLGASILHKPGPLGGSYDADIDLSNQPEGVYLINIKLGEINIYRKIILTK